MSAYLIGVIEKRERRRAGLHQPSHGHSPFASLHPHPVLTPPRVPQAPPPCLPSAKLWNVHRVPTYRLRRHSPACQHPTAVATASVTGVQAAEGDGGVVDVCVHCTECMNIPSSPPPLTPHPLTPHHHQCNSNKMRSTSLFLAEMTSGWIVKVLVFIISVWNIPM